MLVTLGNCWSNSVLSEKNPRVRKIFVRNSGAGNGCANFMDAWKKCGLSAGKTHVHKIPPLRGGVYFGFWGGGEVPIFIFMGARIFLKKRTSTPTRKRFPHSTVYDSVYKHIFDTLAFLKTHRHAVYHCLKEVQKPFRHASSSVLKTRISTRACLFLKRAFAPI